MKHKKSAKIRLVPKIRDMTYMEYEYSARMCEPRLVTKRLPSSKKLLLDEEAPVQVVFEMPWNLISGKRKVR